MEVRTEIGDAYEAARRCWQAMDETQDFETRLALWRAAVRYAGLARMKAERISGEKADPLLAHSGSGGQLSARW